MRGLRTVERRAFYDVLGTVDDNLRIDELWADEVRKVVDGLRLLLARDSAHRYQFLQRYVGLVVQRRFQRNLQFFELQRERVNHSMGQILDLGIRELPVLRPQPLREHRRKARNHLRLRGNHLVKVLSVYHHKDAFFMRDRAGGAGLVLYERDFAEHVAALENRKNHFVSFHDLAYRNFARLDYEHVRAKLVFGKNHRAFGIAPRGFVRRLKVHRVRLGFEVDEASLRGFHVRAVRARFEILVVRVHRDVVFRRPVIVCGHIEKLFQRFRSHLMQRQIREDAVHHAHSVGERADYLHRDRSVVCYQFGILVALHGNRGNVRNRKAAFHLKVARHARNDPDEVPRSERLRRVAGNRNVIAALNLTVLNYVKTVIAAPAFHKEISAFFKIYERKLKHDFLQNNERLQSANV